MRQRLMLTVVALALVLSRAPQEATATDWCSGGVCQEWVARYDGPASYQDGARALTVDESGNVYVTGISYGAGIDYDYATIKYGPDGSEEWVARYSGPGGDDDWANDLAVDGFGNVYVTGYSEGLGTGNDYLTVKYGPDGSEQWVARHDGPTGGSDRARALSVDGSGSVYVTGTSQGDYATIKYGPDGTQEWVARYDGPVSGTDSAWALAVGESGDVYVTGWSDASAAGYSDYLTIKYGPDGSEEWVARYDGPINGFDYGYALAVDGSDNVYVTGASDGFTFRREYATVKYGPDGSERWAARYVGPGMSDEAQALAVDGSGNVYVTGWSYGPGTERDYATVKYGPDGSEQWVARYDGLTGDWDAAQALGLDELGNVYVTGVSDRSSLLADYVTIRYGPDGSEQWVVRYDGAGRFDEAKALVVDGLGNVYVTGGSDLGAPMDGDYVTIKYAPDTDEDGLADHADNCPFTPNSEQEDMDEDGLGDLCDPCIDDADCDKDGCADSEEQPDVEPPLPGGFDPLAWHDFYEVPVPAVSDPEPNGSRDQAVTMSDVVAVLFYVGTSDGGPTNLNGVAYDSVKGSCDIDADTVADKEGLCYDRSPSAEPNPPWEAGPPSGAVNMPDVLAVLAQVGLDCSGPP